MKKFLLIDDESDFLELLSEALVDEFDTNIQVSTNPVEALELLQSEKFDLVLSDYMMPKINGGDLVKSIRAKDGPNKDTPIIILTGNVEAIPQDVKGLKSISFLNKLYYLTHLTSYVKKALS